MDTLGALVFGIVIINAIRSRGVTDKKLITRYAVWASLISGVGLTLVYLSLFKLGMGSHDVAANASNGAIIYMPMCNMPLVNLALFFLPP